MSDLLKIQLKQESDKLSGTGRGKLFESALERIAELEQELKGPDNYETWKDAAIDERVKRVAAIKERDELAAHVELLQDHMDYLQEKSVGVAGLHMNGDIASWDSLRKGGQFESWLMVFDEAPTTSLNAVRRKVAHLSYQSGVDDCCDMIDQEDVPTWEMKLRSIDMADWYTDKRYPDKE